jgi:hypothetical protein
MTHVGPAPVATPRASFAGGGGFVEWNAVFAGAVLAAALSFVLLTFGTAIGLSMTSPWPNSGLSAKVVASLAVFWAMIQQIGAFMVGGYVAGRVRSRWLEATEHEVEFRDGLHGGLVWALGVVIGAALFMATAGVAAKTGADVLSNATASTTNSSAMDGVVDAMLRPATVAQAAPAPAPAGQAAAARPRVAGTADDTRAEVSRILATSVTRGSLSEPNRTYLVQLVAQRSGISQQEAEKRVNDAFTAAREAADKARRAAVLGGLVAAVSLVVSFGAAWWAAMKGGHHRDNSVPARFPFNQRRRTLAPTS